METVPDTPTFADVKLTMIDEDDRTEKGAVAAPADPTLNLIVAVLVVSKASLEKICAGCRVDRKVL